MLEAEHMCMSVRGVEKPGSSTVTTQFTGSFRDNPEEQVQFITMIRGAIVNWVRESEKWDPRVAREDERKRPDNGEPEPVSLGLY